MKQKKVKLDTDGTSELRRVPRCGKDPVEQLIAAMFETDKHFRIQEEETEREAQ